jgi:small subunit ribosomal protein S6
LSLYESTFVGRQDLSTNQVSSIIDSLTDLIKKNSGSVAKKEYCGLRPLAYPIRKNRKGHYILVNIHTNGNKNIIDEINQFFLINEDIIRHITLLVKTHDEEASSLYQQSKSFRESRSWDTTNN